MPFIVESNSLIYRSLFEFAEDHRGGKGCGGALSDPGIGALSGGLALGPGCRWAVSVWSRYYELFKFIQDDRWLGNERALAGVIFAAYQGERDGVAPTAGYEVREGEQRQELRAPRRRASKHLVGKISGLLQRKRQRFPAFLLPGSGRRGPRLTIARSDAITTRDVRRNRVGSGREGAGAVGAMLFVILCDLVLKSVQDALGFGCL